jgi:lipopolysaccharide transport system ATP-binding protein
MGEVASEGRTVLLVSHNMAAVGALCGTGIHLHGGRLTAVGSAAQIVASYVRYQPVTHSTRTIPATTELGLMHSSVEYSAATTGTRLVLRLSICANRALSGSIDFRFKDAFGLPIAFASLGALAPSQLVSFRAGVNDIVIEIPADGFAAGSYSLSIDLTNPGVAFYDRAEDCIAFAVDSINTRGTFRPIRQSWGYGSFLLPAARLMQSGTEDKCSETPASI